MTHEISDAEKGRKFEAEVQSFVEDVVGDNPDIKVLSELSLPGLSAYWTADIVILGRSLLTNEFTMYLAIIDRSLENGRYKSHEPEPVMIVVKELGVKGWIKGER